MSNNNPASMEVIRSEFTADGHTMDDYFDKVYLSYELRELKPSEAIFRKVIADSGIVPAQTLLIGNEHRGSCYRKSTCKSVYTQCCTGKCTIQECGNS